MRATNYLVAIAARQLFMLGANLTSYRASSQNERGQKRQQQLRNLFWICYTLDKDVSLRTGQPPTLPDENCNLSLPPGYLNWVFSDPVKDDNRYKEPIFPFDLRLSMIKSRAHNELYSVSALKKSDADLLNSIRKLDNELEEWRLSISPRCRPTVFFSPETSDPNVSIHSAMLHLNYYLCMTIIHEASSRCKAWMNGGGMMNGVSSSLTLSIEASRSILRYVEAAEYVLVDCVSWYVFLVISLHILTTSLAH
jgi:hypothetical protein